MHASRRHAALVELSDELLMERYACGDGAAFEEIFRRYEGRAYSYFAKRTRSMDRAQDLYQELFLRVHRGRHAFDPARDFASWFFQIAHRLLIDDERRAYRGREVPFGAGEPQAESASTRERVAARELLGQALGSLSSDERYVLVGAKAEGLGYPELAVRLGKSAEAVKKLASRAMQRLRSSSLGREAGGSCTAAGTARPVTR